MKVIKSDKVVMCDVDDTLVLWDKSQFDYLPKLTVKYRGNDILLTPHQKNINLLIKLYKLGYTIIVWSGSGAKWAEVIVKALNLVPYVSICLSKPSYYIDDLEATVWCGQRIWRNLDGSDGSRR